LEEVFAISSANVVVGLVGCVQKRRPDVETLREAPIRFAQNELKVHRSFRVISAKCEPSTENVFGEVSNGDLAGEGAALAPKRFLTGPWANSVEFMPGNQQQAMSYDLEF